MAYVGHSPVREFRTSRAFSASAGLTSAFAKSALVAMAAAAAILALSEVGGTAAGGMAMAKGDRIAAPHALVAEAGGGFSVDAAARTTTVERGAATPLSPESPFRADR